MAELSGSGTRNPAVPGLCPPLAGFVLDCPKFKYQGSHTT